MKRIKKEKKNRDYISIRVPATVYYLEEYLETVNADEANNYGDEEFSGNLQEDTTLLSDEYVSTYETERMIFSLAPLEVEILLLRYVGYSAAEIVEITDAKNVREVYGVNNVIREKVDNIMV